MEEDLKEGDWIIRKRNDGDVDVAKFSHTVAHKHYAVFEAYRTKPDGRPYELTRSPLARYVSGEVEGWRPATPEEVQKYTIPKGKPIAEPKMTVERFERLKELRRRIDELAHVRETLKEGGQRGFLQGRRMRNALLTASTPELPSLKRNLSRGS